MKYEYHTEQDALTMKVLERVASGASVASGGGGGTGGRQFATNATYASTDGEVDTTGLENDTLLSYFLFCHF